MLGAAAAPGWAVTGADPIVVIAGQNTQNAANTAGDGGPATAAVLVRPRAAAADAAGRVYVVQRSEPGVRQVGTDGIIRRFAGNYQNISSGDGGPALSAQTTILSGVAVDPAGNVFIAEEGGTGRIRRIDTSGIIRTVADGFPGLFGLTTDAAGNVFGAVGSGRVIAVTPGGSVLTVAGTGTGGYNGDGIPATQAQLQGPGGVAVDAAGNLFIADAGRVRRVDAATGLISTIAGDGTAGTTGDGGPATAARIAATGIAVDRAGNVYVAEGATGHRIRRIDAATGVITTIAGNGTAGFAGNGGPASGSVLNTPFGISIDSTGSLLIGDEGSSTVRRIVNAPPVATLGASPASGLAPLAVAFDGSASSGVNDGIISHSWDFGDGTAASGAAVSHTYAAAGTYTARLTVMDASGATATATRTVAVAAPALRLGSVRMAATWKASRVGGRIIVTASADRATRYRLSVLPASGRGKALLTRTFRVAAAGSFTRRLPLAGRLVPGPYLVRVADIGPGAQLAPQEVRASVPAPREGVVARAGIATAVGGRARTSIKRGPGILFADFRFAALPRKGRALTVTWFWSGRSGAIATLSKTRTRRVSAFVRSRSGALAAGRYRAELRAGGTLVAVTRTRIR